MQVESTVSRPSCTDGSRNWVRMSSSPLVLNVQIEADGKLRQWRSVSADAWTRSAVPVVFAKTFLGLRYTSSEGSAAMTSERIQKGSEALVPVCPVHLNWALPLVQPEPGQLTRAHWAPESWEQCSF